MGEIYVIELVIRTTVYVSTLADKNITCVGSLYRFSSL